MNFGEALEALKKGKKVTRSIWGGYWFMAEKPHVNVELENGYERNFYTNPMIFAVLKDNGGVTVAQPYQADILANDWMVIK
ncbi:MULTISPECIES: Thoeris anti-defense Tad2 family protein [Bacillus cereus group]|uniref:Thoeris anti-defense Tad2 family protein n=1 Tax=Bacillus cereus group TaxID=86661 RepID=UPI0009356DBC|nr:MULTISPECIES: MW1434 family type I TA system toxin [Bacillus cereus group]MCC2351954.1 DUF2829 domain-containing protein [Bacillus pacificus]MCU5247301.1 DUF2829 domain-containing protein [Bacillus pacificus]MCU5467482.1 DUF2829 domain-containing protein [Bacillus pacificus]MDR4408166.1 DUF2829 domain-containing protein [Bacillus anthracis]HDR7486375.1 DUF2829 domain-containing protein [Bacillus pacificus]